jgi:hypothetical protein
MKKTILLSAIIALPFWGKSQIFQEDWDGNGPGISAWTLIDGDGLTPFDDLIFPDAWDVLPPGISGETTNVAASTSWFNPPGQANRWLISPAIAITGTSPTLVWQAKAFNPYSGGTDGYNVMLSPTAGTTMADFPVTLFGIPGENSDWIERQVDLSAYVGQTIRFAFVENTYNEFALFVDNIKVVNGITPPPPPTPDCPVLTAPADGATNVSYSGSGVSFSWEAVTGADSYNFYFNGGLLANTTSTGATITGLSAGTTYHWNVTAVNSTGESTGCSQFSFTTLQNSVAPYCGPLVFTYGDEPITNVKFADLDNSSDATAYVGNYHEVFLDKVAHVTAGQTYTLTLQGDTEGYTDEFVAFIDWNQNGILDDDGEVYPFTEKLDNSTGTDGKTVSLSITIPSGATSGNTRMRIKKIWDGSDSTFLDPCSGAASYGQAEDYTVNISGTAAVADVSKENIKVYPNPVKDIFNIDAPSTVKSVAVFDISGKQVLTKDISAAKSQIDFSKLATGTYLVKITLENGTTASTKVIKQ